MVAESSTPEYQRAKCKRFYYSRKLRDPVSHKAKQNIVVSEGFPDTYRVLCRNCNMRDQFERRREKGLVGGHAARERHRRNQLKLETFDHYGGARCSCCGKHEGDLDVLTLDHTEPCRLGRNRPHAGWRLYQKLRILGYPPGFSVMCFNCNWLKGIESVRKNGSEG